MITGNICNTQPLFDMLVEKYGEEYVSRMPHHRHMACVETSGGPVTFNMLGADDLYGSFDELCEAIERGFANPLVRA